MRTRKAKAELTWNGAAITTDMARSGVGKLWICNRSVYRAKELAARYPEQAEFIYFKF